MDGRTWNSGYQVTVDGGRTQVWVRSIREVTRLFNEAGLTISASTVHAIQSQRDDREAGRPNARKIRPRLPEWATFLILLLLFCLEHSVLVQ